MMLIYARGQNHDARLGSWLHLLVSCSFGSWKNLFVTSLDCIMNRISKSRQKCFITGMINLQWDWETLHEKFYTQNNGFISIVAPLLHPVRLDGDIEMTIYNSPGFSNLDHELQRSDLKIDLISNSVHRTNPSTRETFFKTFTPIDIINVDRVKI